MLDKKKNENDNSKFLCSLRKESVHFKKLVKLLSIYIFPEYLDLENKYSYLYCESKDHNMIDLFVGFNCDEFSPVIREIDACVIGYITALNEFVPGKFQE